MAAHNIFISHRYEDEGLIAELKSMLASAGAEVRDSSMTSANPNDAHNEEYIKSLLRSRIDWAGKIVVIVSPETHRHEWVDWEIDYARKFPDKRIIGVFAPGVTTDDLPEGLEDYANSIVNWDAGAIVDALENDRWTDPDGGPTAPHDIPRAPC